MVGDVILHHHCTLHSFISITVYTYSSSIYLRSYIFVILPSFHVSLLITDFEVSSIPIAAVLNIKFL